MQGFLSWPVPGEETRAEAEEEVRGRGESDGRVMEQIGKSSRGYEATSKREEDGERKC